MPEWYLVHVRAGKEKAVRDQLSQRLPEVFLPTLRARVRRWNKLISTIVPLFPCYLFAMFLMQYDLLQVRSSPGVREVVTAGSEPLVVPPSIIDQLKERCSNGPIELPAKSLHQGERVIIADGPFRGFEALFERYLSGPERVAVLLSVAGYGGARAVLPADMVVAATT